MGYVESVDPDITETLPVTLGGASLETGAAYPADFGWDVVIGGLGFRLRISDQHPYRRETDQFRKQQFDASNEAGEQSLGPWWLRSQASWHHGAGVKWYEPGAEPETAFRFAQSMGINPWRQGELTLLHTMDELAVSLTADAYVNTMRVAGEDGFAITTADNVEWVTADGTRNDLGGGLLSYTTLTQPASSGTVLWIGHSAGITRYDVGTNTAVAVYTAAGPCRVWWVKSRLIVSVGNKLYEVPPRTTTGGVVETDGELLYDHPVAEWVWTDVTETGGAVLAAGHSGGESALYRFVLTDVSGVPTWSSAEQVAPMPAGELILCMGVYLGTFLVLGTNLGVRVGAATPAGDVQYGPLTIETSSPIKALAFRDRFAYVAVDEGQPDGTSGVARIDLSGEQETGIFPWAWDVTTGGIDPIHSLAAVGSTDRIVIGSTAKVFVQSATDYVAEGWLSTGQIRYRTVEPKVFRQFTLNALLNAGEVQVTAITPDEAEHRVFTFTAATGTNEDALIRLPNRPTSTHLTFRIYMRTATADPTVTPKVTGFQVKALPAPERMELIQYPVSLFDTEVDRHGHEWSMPNGAYVRFAQLKLLESTGAPVRVTDVRTEETFVGTVEEVAFLGTASPDRNSDNFGGIGTVTVRRL